MKTWVKVAWIIGAVVIVVGIGWAILRRGGGDDGPRTVAAERGDIKQEVAFTGSLKARRSVTMGFEAGGTVREVLVEVGDAVNEGDVLVRLDTSLAALELAKAKADLAAAQEQKRLGLVSAQEDLEHTKAENEELLEKRRQAVRDAKAELDQQKQVHVRTDSESGESATTETAVLTLRAKESAYHATQEALEETIQTVERQNQLKRSAAAEAAAVFEATNQASGEVAGLASLEASRRLAAVRLSKNVLTAPFSGVVTEVNGDKGEFVAAGAVVAGVATTGQQDLELSADVPETDAAKLEPGQQAIVTFDAYGSNETWNAEVVSVAPAAELIEGVPTFEVTLQLLTSDPRFKPGLTANITVHAAERKNVIALPRRAVITQNGRQFVRVLEDGAVREVNITTGLLGSDGRVEITSGLAGGEEVMIGNDQ